MKGALVREAEAAVRLAAGCPARAAEDARALQQRASEEQDLELASVAERALGLAAKELGDLAGARAHLRAAVELAHRHGLVVREGEARMSLSFVLVLGGDTAEALDEAERAAGLLRGADAARLEGQKALILHRLGRHDQALHSYELAAHALVELGLTMDAAQTYANRGVLHASRGNFTAAEVDLGRAEELYLELGLEVAAAEVRHNLGFLAARRGNVPVALACYDAAAAEFRRLEVTRPAALLDRCESLLAVRLVREARSLATVAVSQLQDAGMAFDLAEARLVLAQACLLDDDHGGALESAQAAWRSFLEQDRPGWAVLAHYAVIRARWQDDGLGAAAGEEASRTAVELEVAGWVVAAADARLIAAENALERGRVDEAETELMAARSARRTGPAELRARAWHAEALLCLARGRERRALAALRAGLHILDEHQATLGATELRVHATSLAGDLARLGLRTAMGEGDPEAVLAWAERWRGGLHRLPRARPPRDAVIAADLAELRQVVTDLQVAAGGGGDTARLLRRQAALETGIKRRSRHAPGSGVVELHRPASVTSLGEALAERALVELVEFDGALHAVTLVAGRARMRPLAQAGEVAQEVSQLRFSLGRVVGSRSRTSSIEACAAALRYACRQLDDLLLQPLVDDVGDRPLVIVPTGVLHRLPWALLPSCASRPVTVAPSATQWLLASRTVPGSERCRHLLVAGPGCHSGADEVAELAPLLPGATTLVGPEATVAAVTTALNGAELAHVVAHGTFRSDNPLFSSLQLADGPLTVYDLELVHRVPRLLVLSACDAGVSAVVPGDELVGVASALLAFGAQNVVASVTPVPDVLTRRLMVGFHWYRAGGLGAAAALAAARVALQADLEADDPQHHAVAGFTCFGAG